VLKVSALTALYAKAGAQDGEAITHGECRVKNDALVESGAALYLVLKSYIRPAQNTNIVRDA
jgi:hypothetical protein